MYIFPNLFGNFGRCIALGVCGSYRCCLSSKLFHHPPFGGHVTEARPILNQGVGIGPNLHQSQTFPETDTLMLGREALPAGLSWGDHCDNCTAGWPLPLPGPVSFTPLQVWDMSTHLKHLLACLPISQTGLLGNRPKRKRRRMIVVVVRCWCLTLQRIFLLFHSIIKNKNTSIQEDFRELG